ncbi:MAG: hypothetical protein EOS34_29560 [Mesorhizobium sp.]|nr:MAG: hypothetical protein EOS34_29560 [Mesorhizobium sp.]
MSKRRGDYNGGSTVLSATGNGFRNPDFPTRKKKRMRVRPEDRAYALPKMSVAERREYERHRREMTEPKFALLRKNPSKTP